MARGLIPSLFLSLTLLFAGHYEASAQWCGGTLEYVVRDRGGRLVDALDVEVMKIDPPVVGTYIRRPLRWKLTAAEQERFNRNKHARLIQSGPPMTEGPDEGKARQKPSNVEGLDIGTFAIRMGCGLKLVELSLKYEGEVMNLRFVDIIELDAVLDSIPFAPGTFEVNLGEVFRNYPTDTSKLNTKGLRSGNQLLLPWHAKGHALIAAENWKRISNK